MSYEAKGIIIKISEPTSGVSKNGKAWHKQDFWLKTEGQYPKELFFGCFGEDKCKNLKLNSLANIHFEIESREWNERGFTNLNVWKIDVLKDGVSKSKSGVSSATQEQPQPVETIEDEDLPF